MTEGLEPCARDVALDLYGGWDDDQQVGDAVVQVSIAMSLKRIADAMTSRPVGFVHADQQGITPELREAMRTAQPGRIIPYDRSTGLPL